MARNAIKILTSTLLFPALFALTIQAQEQTAEQLVGPPSLQTTPPSLSAADQPTSEDSGKLFISERFKTHLRWTLGVGKGDVEIIKKGADVDIVVKNETIYKGVKADIEKIKLEGDYIREVVWQDEQSIITVKLSNEFVDLFSFYRDLQKKQVMDFWIDENMASSERPSNSEDTTQSFKKIVKDEKVADKTDKTDKEKIVAKKAEEKPEIVESIIDKTKQNNLDSSSAEMQFVSDVKFRDFRYGAPFIWDYTAYGPEFVKTINLTSKTPEFFYPVANLESTTGEKETHVQLTINLYRKKKWGLMYKSIKLYQEKYGEDKYVDLLEYLKANAILRTNFEKFDKASFKVAVSMLDNISEHSTNYEMRRGVLKYLISYYYENKEYIQSLKKAQILYTVSRENFDIEESEVSAVAVLNNLSNLNQLEALQEFAEEKTIQKLIPAQTLLAFKLYTMLRLNKPADVVSEYEKNEKALIKPIDKTIVFNVAESYYRLAKYSEAIKMYDSFAADYSYDPVASRARLRIALMYEILDRDIGQTLDLYKSTIDRSQDLNVSYEAKLRYVALRTLRKKKIDNSDLEIRAFLEIDEELKEKLSKENRRLLWLVRLRSFIVDQSWTKALSYLNAIPLNSMSPPDRRVFEGDGAEIVYGIMTDLYKQSQYSKVLKVWTMYKERYVTKVATDPFLNYIVGHSLVKLGLYDGFDAAYAEFERNKESPTKTYPVWTEKNNFINSERMLLELKLVRNLTMGNWAQAQEGIVALSKVAANYNKINYYYGHIAYKLKQYRAVIDYVETFFAGEDGKSVHDGMEVAEMILAYTDSLYQLGMLDKYKNVARALVNDTKKYATGNIYMQEVLERVSYLEIEIYAGEKNLESSLLAEKKILEFKKNYPKSDYAGRVEYLLALAYIENKKETEGKSLLDGIIKSDKIPQHIKELARSELALLKIKESTI
ncbi:MAG: hypothetical protein A2504_04215 [Bdellovibrionales bacterium RIFOXYD12_FULL_39_22]|nr:MAG: hypothetical protein A2385_07610 [Bdellovibrionales bacterium RIFOXYB1_FULL_39_21]OFZ42125.1 MAG: hypothetical protein A2485_09575 [Bdellovibrionales bacterium RIFOXYC12_FULL_39_17]OFZ50841.1 MAG: hypothetical protein A2404_06525 [Bdellovibrionales bacterium RIFOXYC1_FULL_39_130]OFZ73619.1 MAG: hypothetical protein A2451_06315 [Bdellovibrionales bacterium RIFOXYC2_FULL_39_8]OFZ78064.1 MAG: hypothetical protein A2560_01695 [Bdellovibrionales bacterium RIFOXYD1_FULL_39_84]OFZ93499.1 MAG: